MRGVIWGICPTAQISDLSHMVQAQNIREAAYIFARSVPYFPKDSIHTVVVDPGVATQPPPTAAKIAGWFYGGPDTGTCTGLLRRSAQAAWETEWGESARRKYWWPNVSFGFHGRGIFDPVAAHPA